MGIILKEVFPEVENRLIQLSDLTGISREEAQKKALDKYPFLSKETKQDKVYTVAKE